MVTNEDSTLGDATNRVHADTDSNAKKRKHIAIDNVWEDELPDGDLTRNEDHRNIYIYNGQSVKDEDKALIKWVKIMHDVGEKVFYRSRRLDRLTVAAGYIWRENKEKEDRQKRR